jgi:ankyrin repeat protein
VDALAEESELQPIHCAAITGDIKTFQKLMELGARIDAPSVTGLQAVHYAILGSIAHDTSECYFSDILVCSHDHHLEIFQEVLKFGGKFDACDSNGIQPLHIAAETGRVDIIQQLLMLGVKVDIMDNDGKQPIHYGVNHYESTSELLANGAKYNATVSIFLFFYFFIFDFHIHQMENKQFILLQEEIMWKLFACYWTQGH